MRALRWLEPAPLQGQDDLPSEFGPEMESELHRSNMNVLVDSLRLAWAQRDDFFVGGNMALYYSASQILHNDFLGPDVFVVLDTRNRARKSWVVWQEERTPDVVIELLSPSTEANDRGAKKQVYARTLSVPEYYLFDPLDGRFEGFRLDFKRRDYTPMRRGADGGYASTVLGLRLAPHAQVWLSEPCVMLRWFTRDGQLLPTPQERAEAERLRAESAESAAEAERLRAESAESAAEAERQRAEAERQRAEAERQRADALEARLRTLGLDP